MARIASRSRLVPSRAPKRATTWVGTSEGSIQFTAVTAGAKILLLSFDVPEDRTVVRTRGVLSIKSDQLAATEEIIGAFGMCVVSDTAAGTGISAIPGPMSTPNWDGWFVFEPFAFSMVIGDATGFANLGKEIVLDNKAMRKVKEGDTIVVVVESGTNGDGMRALANIRQLFKLH